MNAPTDIQIIRGPDGSPAFVVVPYADYVASHPKEDLVPHEVIGLIVKEGISPAAAWRRYQGLTQAQVAATIGITQAAYAQQEKAAKPRKETAAKIAAALGITMEQLDIG